MIVASTLLLGACVEENGMELETKEVSLRLSVAALSMADPVSVNQDQTFGSLAIYLYHNDAAFTLDKSALLPSFASVSSKDVLVKTQVGAKILYLIANYAGKTFKLTDGSALTLTPATTKQQLDNIMTESSSGFLPSSLLMVGKQSFTLTSADNGAVMAVALRRLQARIDVHVYKGANFGANVVTLESVTLHHQVLNSEVKFDAATPQMLAVPQFQTQQTATGSSALSSYTNGTVLQPINAQANFYSYQNLVTALSPLQATAPYLEIKILSNGIGYTYKGYFTDTHQTTGKYSLLQNNLYQILAVLDVNALLTLRMTVLPWNQKKIEYERPITANDFAFGAWGTSWGGLNAQTMNTDAGVLEDAVFQFELKAPIGAAWTASLTNGLDFSFASSTAGTTTAAVSKGFTNIGNPVLIAVRANKKWTGGSRDTDFYIAVEGNEIPINPMVGTQRRYDGTETRIKIKQVASYN
ncbi:MAG: hypothetical protein RR304_08105 [Bacteroides sp.]